ncbi:ABC transporter ATP-binding protein [Nitratireductor indicus]|uniref:ABC transporter ATP-binding protein n=1 Tax=Nitratireductor indicus C115 TaxID=1231190 RepID=K2P0C0_9HYPH|nr:ABC transporter ATP-binding protein [Nitratireductor indicus]EKF40771.1 ABC transporter ATP-binding protein [Nitratireductor indicus C115]MDS1136397.1 ABC transporter ATP-binding protein [Nitratireductor indicus]SFQ75583.1 Cu-processing system ATP-binding protein [Nitratireductor indicus]
MTCDDCSNAVLSVRGASVRFGDFQALRQVFLTVSPGERVALLGHNGAGKTTLFKSVLGFLGLEGGVIDVAGHRPGSREARLAVSYLPESVAFAKTLSGIEIMRFFARLKGIDPREALPLLERVGLADAGGRRVGAYSKGMRQRLGLAQALIGKPRLLLLDEPTSGLDPVSRREFYEIIDAVSAEGTAVLLSSHALTEVEGRTDRIAILSKGRLVADGPLPALAREARLPITVNIKAKEGRADSLHSRLGGVRANGKSVILTCQPEAKVDLLGQMAALGAEIDDFDITMPSLDDIYRHYSLDQEKGAQP